MIAADDRRAILSGRCRPLTFPAPPTCPVEPGAVVNVHPHVAIEVTTVKRKGQQWRVHYRLHDFRPHLLHRDSSRGYTQIPALAMEGEPECVSDEFLETVKTAKGVDQANALTRERHRVQEQVARLHYKLGLNPSRRMERTLRRQLARAEQDLASAA